MRRDRTVRAPKPERARRDVAGLAAPAPAPLPIIIVEPDPERVVEIVLITASEDGERPL